MEDAAAETVRELPCLVDHDTGNRVLNGACPICGRPVGGFVSTVGTGQLMLLHGTVVIRCLACEYSGDYGHTYVQGHCTKAGG